MEQRLVAVLSTDLVYSTVVIQRVGPIEADRLRRAHFDELATLLAHHEGELVKTLGDGVMAVFKLATSALDVAIAAQRAFNDADRPDRFAGLRAGISVGQVSSGLDDYHGMAVDLAARLCRAANPGQILCAPVVQAIAGPGTGHVFESVGPLRLKDVSDSFAADQLAWARPGVPASRVVLADDAVIVRQGLARLLHDEGFLIVGEAANADELLELVDEMRPDVVVTDIRMPPRMNLDGLEAALEIRRRFPHIGILLLSQHIEAEYAMRLLGNDATGVGYLLKERISALDTFVAAVHRVAAGGTAVDVEVVEALMKRVTRNDPLSALSEREREVLSLMAEGMSNAGIAERLIVSQRTVESHVASIFTKLDMLQESRDDRRVLAVVRYLEARR